MNQSNTFSEGGISVRLSSLSKKQSAESSTTDDRALTQVYDQCMLANRDVTYRDKRLLTMRTGQTHYNMPFYKSKKQWERRKKYLREQILVSAGLWPMPPKNPLNPTYYHKIDHDDYIVETLTIEPYSGFYLAGNLYRPQGEGPFPGILSPHGHFKYGRLNDSQINSIPARCINFARQGYVAYAYDMVGYNDTRQVSHIFAKDDSVSTLYGINLLGLQLRNSLRALDFLENLPMVDKNRIGVTGASGGGTQTFLLAAVDDRVQAAAPANMVSHIFQGGDLCENAPGLRIGTNNVEIAAMMAPKPLLLIANTHDWTKNTPWVEYPMIRSIYELYDAAQGINYAYFDYEHNYNEASREAVYQWFGKWLLQGKKTDTLKERPYEIDSAQNLLAFMNRKTSSRTKSFKQYPTDTYDIKPSMMMDADGLKSSLKKIYRKQLEGYWPTDKKSLATFKHFYGTAMKYLIGVTEPDAVSFKVVGHSKGEGFTTSRLLVAREEENDWIPCTFYQSLEPGHATAILTAGQGKSSWVSKGQSKPKNIVRWLMKTGINVLIPDLFKQGEHNLQGGTITRRNEETEHFTTFNLTDRQNRIQDLLTLISFIKQTDLSQRIGLYASGQTGITGLLLATVSSELDRIVLDGNRFNPTTDQNMLSLDVPGIMRIGGLKTIAALASSQHITIFNVDKHLRSTEINNVANLAGNRTHFRMINDQIPDTQIANLLA
jgi:dienelactone hydrolase